MEQLSDRIGEVVTTAKAAMNMAKEAKETIFNINRGGNDNGVLAKKVQDIEIQLANLKVSTAHDDSVTAIVGGLQDASSANAAIE